MLEGRHFERRSLVVEVSCAEHFLSDASLRWFIDVPRCSSCRSIQNTPMFKIPSSYQSEDKDITFIRFSTCQIFYAEEKKSVSYYDIFPIITNILYK